MHTTQIGADIKCQIRDDPSELLDPRSKNVNIENFSGTRSDLPAYASDKFAKIGRLITQAVQTNLNSPKRSGTWKFGVSVMVGDQAR